MTAALSLVVIRARDIETSRKFYETLGLDFVREQHGSDPEHYACEQGGMVMEIYPERESDGDASRTMLGFAVTDLEETLRRLEAENLHQGEIRRATSQPVATLTDPYGYAIRLMQKAD